MTETTRPGSFKGLHHVALMVEDVAACEHFYCDLLGMAVEWRPDADNVYLTSGNDNLALHRADAAAAPMAQQRLDHIGFILENEQAVDDWHAYLSSHQVEIVKAPKTHRDGARSFYCKDPAGTTVQLIFHPPLKASL